MHNEPLLNEEAVEEYRQPLFFFDPLTQTVSFSYFLPILIDIITNGIP